MWMEHPWVLFFCAGAPATQMRAGLCAIMQLLNGWSRILTVKKPGCCFVNSTTESSFPVSGSLPLCVQKQLTLVFVFFFLCSIPQNGNVCCSVDLECLHNNWSSKPGTILFVWKTDAIPHFWNEGRCKRWEFYTTDNDQSLHLRKIFGSCLWDLPLYAHSC